MKNLQIIPDFHKHEAVVKVAFAFDNVLIPLGKVQKGVRWCQTFRSFYFRKKEFQLNVFYKVLKKIMLNKIFKSLLIIVFLISCDKKDENINTPEKSAPTVKLNTTYEVTITEDITYAQGLSHDSWNSANTSVVPLLMDSYVPDNDLQNRPLLMLIHGGGFSGYYKINNGFNLGLNYYPSLFTWHNGDFDFHYSHLIMFELIFKIKAYKPRKKLSLIGE